MNDGLSGVPRLVAVWFAGSMHGIEEAGGRGDRLSLANRHRMITWATQHHVGVCGFIKYPAPGLHIVRKRSLPDTENPSVYIRRIHNPPFNDALVTEGISCSSFAVDDLQSDYESLTVLGAASKQSPTDVRS